MEHHINSFVLEQLFCRVRKVDCLQGNNLTSYIAVDTPLWLFTKDDGIQITIGEKQLQTSDYKVIHVTTQKGMVINITQQATIYILHYQYQCMQPHPFTMTFLENSLFRQPVTAYQHISYPIVQLVSELYTQSKIGKGLVVQTKFQRLLIEVCTCIADVADETERFQKAKHYIDGHRYGQITVQHVADFIQISNRHLLQLFRKYLGQSPKCYIQQHRQQLAIRYLSSSRYEVKEVAQALDFATEVYFAQTIKKWTGKLPNEFVRKTYENMSEKSINNENHFHYNESNQFARAIYFQSEDNWMMKKYVQLPFLLGILLLLAACSNDKEVEETAQKVATHIVTDALGREVEVPVNPQRIVTDQYFEILIALGVQPVGVSEHVLKTEYMKDHSGGVESIGNPTNMESVLALKPDLIITTAEPGGEDTKLENFEKIAPTVVVPWMGDYDMYGQMREVAKLINKEKEADEWIANLEQKGQEVQNEIQTIIGQDETVSLFMTYGKEAPRIYGGRNIGHIFYRLLHLTPTPYIQQKMNEDPNFSEFNNENISIEVLPDYVGDWIFIVDYATEDNDNRGTLNEIEESSLWKNLDAVKNNQVIYLPQDPFFSYSPIAIEQSLERIVDLLKERAQ